VDEWEKEEGEGVEKGRRGGTINIAFDDVFLYYYCYDKNQGIPPRDIE
jgi:hypothetical protein